MPAIPYRVDGFFGLRTPLLPFSDYLDWTVSLRTPAAAAGDLEAAIRTDRQAMRDKLGALLRRPDVREAIYLGSPTLEQAIDEWLENPESSRGHAAEAVLMRYCHRLSHRCTPFGLFAAHGFGVMGDCTRLHLGSAASYHRHTRLDWWYLTKLLRHYSADRPLRESMNCHPNSTLYRAAGRLRYAECVTDQNNQSQYRLVAVEASPPLQFVLAEARGGRPFLELADHLARQAEVAHAEAVDFLHELIDSQLLVTDLEPCLIGGDATGELVRQFARSPSTERAAAVLRDALGELARFDAGGLGHPPETYRRLSLALEVLPIPVDPSLLLQVDLFSRLQEAMLGPQVAAELEQALATLYRLVPPSPWDPLSEFKEAFSRRYEERWMPLLEVLDPETGIGFPPETHHPTVDAPLLQDFARQVRQDDAGEGRGDWGAAEVYMLRRIRELDGQGLRHWQLSEEDLVALTAPGERAAPADSAAVVAVLQAESPQAVDRGDFSLHLRLCYGPSAARLLGRFCHGDADLFAHVAAHLRREEASRPAAVFAEVSFLPQPRLGNVLARPPLRDYEIPLLTLSSLPADRRIDLDDLLVTVADGRVVLYSNRLAREVIPRISSAAKFDDFLGVYEFLGVLQAQQTPGPLRWRWGVLEDEAFLPRVSHGRTIFARAQWRVTSAEFQSILEHRDAERFRLVREWRRERGLPRLVVLVDNEDDLLLDLDNILSIDSFCELVRTRPFFVLAEAEVDARNLPVRSDAGRHTHELIIPVLRAGKVSASPAPPSPGKFAGVASTFPPGSEWLYGKLYGGQGTADLVLTDAITPLLADLRRTDASDGWFFIRYEDPDPHLRLRLHGEPRRLAADVLPALTERIRPLIDNGMVWRFELGTYLRESDRYGGPENIRRAECLFEFDSDAALAITACCTGDAGAEMRWQLVLAGMDRWLGDFGFDLPGRYAFACQSRDAYAAESGLSRSALEAWCSARFRPRRQSLEQLLDLDRQPDHEAVRLGLASLVRRSEWSAPLIAEMLAKDRSGQLAGSRDNLVHSLIHMFVNRSLRSFQRRQELVLYDFLARLYRSRLARLGLPVEPRGGPK